MSDINFEQDARENLDSVNEGKKLSDQVVKLQELEDQVALKEHELKELKRKMESFLAKLAAQNLDIADQMKVK